MANKKTLFHPLNAPDGREFDADHADRMLAMEFNGGWYEKNDQKQIDAIIGDAFEGQVEVSTKKSKDRKGD